MTLPAITLKRRDTLEKELFDPHPQKRIRNGRSYSAYTPGSDFDTDPLNALVSLSASRNLPSKNTRLPQIDRFDFADGSYYEGDFLNDAFHGKGKLTFTNGSFYQGNFFFGQLTGKGQWVECGEYTYVGHFVNSKFHGEGKLTFIDGTTYEGIFKNNAFKVC